METLSPQLAPHKIGIRWPNDLFLKNKKFTGILTESPTPELAVIGFGVNLNNSMKESPKDMQNLSITTIFDVLGKKFDREEILELIIECFLERFDALQVDYLNNRRILIETLRKNCIQIGTQTTVKYGDKTVSGKCLDIAEDGRMVLDVDGELQYIH